MSQISNQLSLLTAHFIKGDDGNKGEEKKEEKRKGKRKESSSRASSPPSKPQAQSVLRSLPIPSRALLEQFDVPFTRPPILEPSDPKIIAKEAKKSEFVRAFRICLRMIGIDPVEWDKQFSAYKERQEKKSVISKEDVALIKLEENISEAIRTEVNIRLNAQEED